MVLFLEQGLGIVTDLKVTDINSRRIRIAWTGVAGARGYRISWSQGGGKCEFDYFESLICFHPSLYL